MARATAAPTHPRFGKFPDASQPIDGMASGESTHWDGQTTRSGQAVLVVTFKDFGTPTPDGDGTITAEAALGDPLSVAQVAYEAYLRYELGLDPTSAAYKRKLKAVRKALGYSYP